MSTKTFTTTIVRDGSACFIPLPFDPKAVFGKVRAPVRVTVNGYTHRSTIAAMGGPPCVPLRKSHREAAGLDGGETLEVRLELDTEERVVDPPADLVEALGAAPPAWDPGVAAEGGDELGEGLARLAEEVEDLDDGEDGGVGVIVAQCRGPDLCRRRRLDPDDAALLPAPRRVLGGRD